MLVLTRKVNEQIYLDVPPSTESIRIMIQPAAIRGDKIRIGIEAPPEVDISRDDMIKGRPAEADHA